ncbi:hypothetical protein C9J85_01040 [Haloferax sp. wsp5]|nr:hypothetical protein C9J85_01040 [Haloferax sp. wsp5]
MAFGGTTYIAVSHRVRVREPGGVWPAVRGSGPDITVTGSESGTKTETWEPEWGDFETVSEDYNFLRLGLEETASPGRSANIEVRVFNDGLGFRVAFDSDFGDFTISSETTEFNFSGDYTAWWIENEYVNPRFEQEYTESSLSAIPAGDKVIETDDGTSPDNDVKRAGAHTPVTMRPATARSQRARVEPRGLRDDGACRTVRQREHEMAVDLAPLPDGNKVSASAPHVTPWRTVQLGTSPSDLVESQLVPLLADPLDGSVFPTNSDALSTRVGWRTAEVTGMEDTEPEEVDEDDEKHHPERPPRVLD